MEQQLTSTEVGQMIVIGITAMYAAVIMFCHLGRFDVYKWLDNKKWWGLQWLHICLLLTGAGASFLLALSVLLTAVGFICK